MAYLAKNIDGSEYIFDKHPYLEEGYWYCPGRKIDGNAIKLPEGTIKKLTGKFIDWSDDPIEFDDL